MRATPTLTNPARAAGLHQRAAPSRDVRVAANRGPAVPQLRDLGNMVNVSDIAAGAAPNVVEELELRDVRGSSYVSRRRLDAEDFDPDAVDSEGLPLVYNEERIAAYWKGRPGELAGRWTKFAGIAAPWLTRLANAVIQGRLEKDQKALAKDAVTNLQDLGPTFIKLGQILSIRPDVLPPPVMEELGRLQDRIDTFPTVEARAVVEEELGAPIEEIFSEFSDEPVAAASLAQVYRARLKATGEVVAVKVQRPAALATISKDLYVMRRAVGVYESLVKRFTAQTTDYQELLSTFAEGLYTEMDFRNEALNSQRMTELLEASEFAAHKLVIPKVYMEHTGRRVLTMEWIDGVKLTTLEKDEINALVAIGQEAFLTQLLEIGFFHGDPHPGNLLKIVDGPDAGKLALLDFGLVAEIPQEDCEAMVSATIHLANRDWDALIDDFCALGFLPRDCDRGLIIPVMDRVLSPYLRGGGAAAFNFQALSQDLLAATLEIPFSVPPYMSLLARSVATLEGIALAGDPQYQMVAQAYPFVVRKVLRNDSSSGASILREILYDSGSGKVKPTRLASLLNAALGYVADEGAGFVDFDAVPADGASLKEVVAFLLSPEAKDLRPLLIQELVTGLDLYVRSNGRRAYANLSSFAPRLPLIGRLPAPPTPPLFVPGKGLMPAEQAVDLLCPELDQKESIYLQTLVEVAASVLGVDPQDLDTPNPQLLLNPTAQVGELQAVLVALAGDEASVATVQEITEEVIDTLAAKQSARVGVPQEQLFPGFDLVKRTVLNSLSVGSAAATSTAADMSAAAATQATAAAAAPGEPADVAADVAARGEGSMRDSEDEMSEVEEEAVLVGATV